MDITNDLLVQIALGEKGIPADKLRAQDWTLLINSVVAGIGPALKRMPGFYDRENLPIFNASRTNGDFWARRTGFETCDMSHGTSHSRSLALRAQRCCLIYDIRRKLVRPEGSWGWDGNHIEYVKECDLVLTDKGNWLLCLMRARMDLRAAGFASDGKWIGYGIEKPRTGVYQQVTNYRIIKLTPEEVGRLFARDPGMGKAALQYIRNLAAQLVENRRAFLDDAQRTLNFLEALSSRLS